MGLTVESKLSELLGNEHSRQIVEKHCPGLSADPRIKMAMNMTLRQIMPFSGGNLTAAMIEAVSEDLARL
jgi:hypothetical protein